MSYEEMFQIIATSHNDAITRGVLNIWTVYDHPTDFPNSYVARRYEVIGNIGADDRPVGRVTEDIIEGELMTIRQSLMQCGLVCLTRSPGDDAKIMETWL